VEQTWHPIYPDLFVDLRTQANEVLSSKLAKATVALKQSSEKVRDKVKVQKVKVEPELKSKMCIAADSSSYPLPFAISRMALRRHRGQTPHTETGFSCRTTSRSGVEIRYERLRDIPRRSPRVHDSAGCPRSMHKVRRFLLIDGPLSVSQWYNLASADVAKLAVAELIQSRNDLLNAGSKTIQLMGVVKKSDSMYFQKGYDLEASFSDQFLFNQLLNFGERTETISITEQILSAATGAVLMEKLNHQIHEFYIKTSRNPLTPPIRVEFPDYLKDQENTLASYVLSTSVESLDYKYDGHRSTERLPYIV